KPYLRQLSAGERLSIPARHSSGSCASAATARPTNAGLSEIEKCGTRVVASRQLHTLIVADQLNFISFRIVYVKRAPMHPRMFSRFHPQPQLLESLLLDSEIRQRYLESDVVNG